MVSKLDESVGRVVAALQNRYMLDNTIIVFMSDNGAPSKDVTSANVNFYPNWGSNFPLRGVSLQQKVNKTSVIDYNIIEYFIGGTFRPSHYVSSQWLS